MSQPLPLGLELRDEAEPGLPPSAQDFRQIYQEHFDFVWRYAAHRGIPPSARDDIVQEVFLVVYRRLGSFEGRSSLRTWIASITINVVRSHRRRKDFLAAPEALSEDLASDATTAPRVLELREALDVAHQALSEMTELQREAFVLCELDELAPNETAEALGLNINTLRTRLRAARKVFDEVTRKLRRREARSK